MLATFETDRLRVDGWHSPTLVGEAPGDLSRIVRALLTRRVTEGLPPGWQGAYSTARATRWIEERDREGATLLVVSKAALEPVGLVFLHESEADDPTLVDLRLGYLLAETSWGQGLGTELVSGLLAWCRQNPVASIIGGVQRGNAASIRVLEKNGFARVRATDPSPGEEFFELRLRGGTSA